MFPLKFLSDFLFSLVFEDKHSVFCFFPNRFKFASAKALRVPFVLDQVFMSIF